MVLKKLTAIGIRHLCYTSGLHFVSRVQRSAAKFERNLKNSSSLIEDRAPDCLTAY